MTKKELVKRTEKFVKDKLLKESSGHDWWHTDRVRNNAMLIGKSEECDLFIVEMASLLHDMADWKLSNYKNDYKQIDKYLYEMSIDKKDIYHISNIIRSIDFKGSETSLELETIEAKIVFDADKLDAMGAIGIARVFAFSAVYGREIFNPEIEPVKHYTFNEYKNNNSTAINHFFEKLLLLKNLMNTKTAKKIAHDRHSFMLSYLQQFFLEVDNEK